jgi:hypothetical protein
LSLSLCSPCAYHANFEIPLAHRCFSLIVLPCILRLHPARQLRPSPSLYMPPVSSGFGSFPLFSISLYSCFDLITRVLLKRSVPDEKAQRWCPAAPWVDRAYAGNPEGSPLRRLSVAMYVFHGTNNWLHGTTNVGFLVDLAVRLGEDRRALPRTNTTKLDLSLCWYHYHGDDVSCYRAKFLGSAV